MTSDGMNLFLTALWFFLPAGMANAGPVFANKIPRFNTWETPLDFGKTYHGQRIFGANKRVRGLVAGIILATLVIAVQKYLFTRNRWVFDHAVFDYRPASVWLLGPLFGAGALLGDAAKSFFKRRRGIAPGRSWIPFDQIDYIIGGLLFTAPIVHPSLELILAVFGVYFGMHLLIVYIGYRTGFRDKPI